MLLFRTDAQADYAYLVIVGSAHCISEVTDWLSWEEALLQMALETATLELKDV